MTEDRRRPSEADFYSGLIGEFIDIYDFHEEHGGFPAFEDDSVGEGVVRTGSQLLAFVSRTKVKQLAVGGREGAGSRYLWCRIEGEDRNDSFVVDCEMAIEAVEKAVPAMDLLRIPVPAYVADVSEDHSVLVGDDRHLTVSLVTVERVPTSEIRSRKGIRFQIAEEFAETDSRPLYSFTMEPLTALLALGVPVFADVDGNQSKFNQELEAFAAEVEAETAIAEQCPEEGE